MKTNFTSLKAKKLNLKGVNLSLVLLFTGLLSFAQTNTFPTSGNVGIGTLTPQYPLDVNGNARVTGNLLVGGGVITTSTLNSTIKINAGDVDVINNLNVFGSMSVTPTSTSSFGSINAMGDIRTQTGYLLNQPIGTPQLGMRVFNAPGGGNNTGPVIKIGGGNGDPDPPLPCSLPNNAPWLQMDGNFRSKAFNPGNQLNASLSMYCAPWNGEGHIESEGTDPIGNFNTPLYINYFCGRDIFLGTGSTGPGSPAVGGTGGSRVVTGDFVRMRKHLEIGEQAFPITDANNIALNVFANDGQGFVLNTTNNNMPAFKINNAGTPFMVFGDGRTQIQSAPNTQALTVTSGNQNFVVYGDGRTRIAGNNPVIETNLNPQAYIKVDNTLLGNTIKAGLVIDTKAILYNGTGGYLNYGILINTNNNSPAFAIYDNFAGVTNPNKHTFLIQGDGSTIIRSENAGFAFDVRDVSDNANFRVKSNGFVYAREVRVMTGVFPDYVFNKDYKRLTIPDLDAYISKNKHLPGFNNENYYIENGINTSEMFVKHHEKIEEAFLYIVELKKENIEAKKENDDLKKRIEALEAKK